MKAKKPIQTLILELRGQKVILDGDLADVFGVSTKVFNQAVERDRDCFPDDFIFQINEREWLNLKSQIVTSSAQSASNQTVASNRSQFVTIKTATPASKPKIGFSL